MRDTRRQRLEVDIDVRLAQVWETLWEQGHPLKEAMGADEDLASVLGAALRCAYSRGYLDALHEDAEGRRAELATANGYRI